MTRHSLTLIASCWLILLIFPQCGPPPPVEPELLSQTRPVYDGYSLAVSVASTEELLAQLPLASNGLRPMNLILEINKSGRVSKIETSDTLRGPEQEKLNAALEQLQFYPGRSKGKTVTQKLPIYLLSAPEKYLRQVILPLDYQGGVMDVDLYWHALKLNGVRLPSISQFGSYFLNLDLNDSSTTLDYLLARLEFDSTGRIKNYELLHSDLGRFTDQVIDAANWAEYNLPPRPDSTPRTAYLRVAALKTVPDPTDRFDMNVKKQSLPDRERLRLLPDTIGLMLKPIPIRYQYGGVFSLLGDKFESCDTIYAAISIDEKGRVSRFKPIGGQGSQYNYYRELMAWTRFYPALAFDGTPRPFKGVIRFECQNSTKVRIRFLWLPGEGSAF